MVHPPRTGGSSITRSWGINRRSGEYQGHHFPPDPKPDDLWVYGFTRNPWDRAVSLYHLANPQHEPKGFNQWVLEGMDGNHTFGRRWLDQISQPTWRWLSEADWVGRFETRDTDLKELSVLLGREMPKEFIAKSPKRWLDGARVPYQEYYNEEAKLYIARRYADDVAKFGYEF